MMKLKRVCKTDPSLPACSISEDDVISGIKQLKRKTACGSDTIQNYHLFFVCPKLVKCLTIYLSNAIGKAMCLKRGIMDLLVCYIKVTINQNHILTATDRCIYYPVW